jgi:hypothetical protein
MVSILTCELMTIIVGRLDISNIQRLCVLSTVHAVKMYNTRMGE